MKEKMKFLSLPLSFFYLFVTIVSCSPTEIDAENQQLKLQANEKAEKAVVLYTNLATIKNRSEYSNRGLTQDLIDEYLVSAGFQPGELTVATVNQIVSGLSQANNLSFEEQVLTISSDPYVKQKLLEIKESGFIEDLQNEEEFDELSFNEKKILLTSNALVGEFNKAVQDGKVDVPCPSEGCTASMVIAGAILGSAICGPLCGVFGGVIGLMFGTSLKD